jgi:hypothetical protein
MVYVLLKDKAIFPYAEEKIGRNLFPIYPSRSWVKGPHLLPLNVGAPPEV